MGQGCYKKILVNKIIVALTTDEMLAVLQLLLKTVFWEIKYFTNLN